MINPREKRLLDEKSYWKKERNNKGSVVIEY